MPDEFDIASENEQLYRDEALKHAKKPEGPPANGLCKWCGAKVRGGRRWCNAEHRDEWQFARDRK